MRRIVPVAILVPLLVGGCGGDSDGGSARAQQPRLTQKQFVEQGNQVCIDSDRRIFRIGGLGSNPTPWRRTRDAAQTAIDEMARLRPPAAKQKRFDSMLASARTLQRAISDVYEGLVGNKYERAQAAQARAVRADTEIKRKAHGLGLTFCEQLLTNWPA